jgi:hypothetical protein
MPLDKITVSRTFHLGDSNFFKVGQEGTVIDGETREELTADAMGYIYSTLKKYCPETDIENPLEKKKSLPVSNVGETMEEDNKEWSIIKTNLNNILFREDAQEYIDTTDYNLTIAAKKIVNSKPLKNKK